MDFEFDFFDLEIIPGLYANGTAEISVHADGVNDQPEWFIGRIFLHGEQVGAKHVMHEVEHHFPVRTTSGLVRLAIVNALEHGTYAEAINDRIASEMDDGRAPQRRMIEAVA
jgi:hypothetical protein